MKRFGTNIVLKGYRHGIEEGKKYPWVASAIKGNTETINIHKQAYWKKSTENEIIKNLPGIIAHEVIHGVLWEENLDITSSFDIGLSKFYRKIGKKMAKQCSYCI